MGIGFDPELRFGNFYLPQKFNGNMESLISIQPFFSVSRTVLSPVGQNHIHQLFFNRKHRIEKSHWILEDHCNLSPPDLFHLFFGFIEKILPLKKNLSGDNVGGRSEKESQEG